MLFNQAPGFPQACSERRATGECRRVIGQTPSAGNRKALRERPRSPPAAPVAKDTRGLEGADRQNALEQTVQVGRASGLDLRRVRQKRLDGPRTLQVLA